MLTVQSRMNQTAFGEHRRMSREEIEARQQRAEILRQKMELEELANDSQVPSFTKKAFNAGAMALGGVAVGLTAGCGTRILIDKSKAFKNSEFMKNAQKYGKEFKDFASKSWKNFKENFKESKVYRKPAAAVKWKYHKFKTSKFGEPIVNFTKKVAGYINTGIQAVKDAKNWLVGKFKSIKTETYEKAAVGTVGTASGACAIGNQIKENQEAGE